MKLGMGLSIVSSKNPAGGGTPPDPDVEAFFARLTPSVTEFYRQPYTTLITSLKAAGVWAKLDALYILRTGNAQWAQRNLIQDAYNLSPVNNPFFTATLGYDGNTNAWLNTQFNPASPTVPNPKFTQNSATLFVKGGRTSGSVPGMMGQQSGTNRNQLHGKYTDNNVYTRLNSGVQNSNAYGGNNDAVFQLDRADSAQTKLYANGVLVDTNTSASTTLISAPLALLVSDVVDGYFQDFIEYAGIGGSMNATEVDALYDALMVWDANLG